MRKSVSDAHSQSGSVRRISRGNYGWSVREGRDCFGTDSCENPDILDPVLEYRNTGSASVVGGFVYRGQAIPELAGRYIYSDYYLGTTWSVRPGQTPTVINRGDARRFAAFAEDADGELYGVSYGGGIFRMRAAAPAQGPAFPTLLSQTGCLNAEDPTAAPKGAIAYEVNLPFWSDGAEKQRFIAVPEGAVATVSADGDLELPAGTVLVKSFTREGTVLETRLLVRHPDGWAGYSYAWAADGSDAEVVFDGRVTNEWLFPSGQDCEFCHNGAAGGSLGLEVGQLAGTSLLDLVDAGILSTAPPGDALPDPSGAAPLNERARAYLHVNCGQCHREDGPQGRAKLDLRFGVAMQDTGLCDSDPRAGDAGLVSPQLLVQGDPTASVLAARMRSTGSVRMPPTGSLRVDETATALIDSWITQGAQCP